MFVSCLYVCFKEVMKHKLYLQVSIARVLELKKADQLIDDWFFYALTHTINQVSVLQIVNKFNDVNYFCKDGLVKTWSVRSLIFQIDSHKKNNMTQGIEI